MSGPPALARREVTYLPVNTDGVVDADALAAAVTPRTAVAFRIADVLREEGVIDADEALRRVTGAQLAQLMFPRCPCRSGRAAAQWSVGPGVAGLPSLFWSWRCR